jgi:peptidoglycan hydrolase FlgJ
MSAADGVGGGGGVGPTGRDALTALRDGRIQGDHARLRAATRLLEGSFYQEMFKAMRETVPDGGEFSGGAGEEMFTGMLDQHMSDEAALRSANGLGAALYARFVRSLDVDAAPDDTGTPPPATLPPAGGGAI